jgi:hypothetical protein
MYTYPFLSTSGQPVSFRDILQRNVYQPADTFERMFDQQILRALGVIDLCSPRTTEQLN